MYTLLLVLIYLAFISLGLPDSLLGAGWPVMHSTFQVSLSHLGIVTMVISGCTIVSSLLSDALTKKLKTSVVTVISVFLTAVALFGFSFATKFWMLVLLAIPYGLGAGSIDAALNNYVALHYSSKHMSWLHCFWGVGTIISPFIMSHALTNAVWNAGFRTVSLLQLGIGVLLLLTLPVWRANKHQAEELSDEKPMGIGETLKRKGVPSLLLGFFAYCSAEGIVMGWTSTFLVQAKHITEERAAAFASLFFIGLTVGRFLGGFLMDRLGDRKMIRLGTAVSLGGMLCVLLPINHELFTLAGLVIIGLGFAPIYPCIIHSTPSNFGEHASGAIIGIQMASAYTGITFMPPLYGLLGKLIGFGIMPICMILFTLLMIVMVEKTFRITTHA